MPSIPPNLVDPQLVLASSSSYRRELLERLQLPFEVRVPQVDETPHAETPTTLVRRLARAKACAVAVGCPRQFVIGSDQVVDIDGEAVSKPGDSERACAQLRAASGRVMRFHTAVCVVAPGGALAERVVATDVQFRILNDAAITAYVEREKPYDCAGAFKIERLGITLVERVVSDDPTALIGLPLIALVDLLTDLGFSARGLTSSG